MSGKLCIIIMKQYDYTRVQRNLVRKYLWIIEGTARWDENTDVKFPFFPFYAN